MEGPEGAVSQEQFVEIVRRHRKAVFSVAYGKVRNVQDAEDITQDVFTEAYQKMARLARHENVLGWLIMATGFRCKDHMRKSTRRRNRESGYAEVLQASGDDENASNGMLEVISTLPEKFRVVLMLKHFARLSYDEISQITGLSKTTIDGRLRTAKKKLKAKYERRQRG